MDILQRAVQVATFGIVTACAISAVYLVTAAPPPYPQPSYRTVDWYMQNRAEMRATLTLCDNNPGTLRQNPDCINADKAKDRANTRDLIDQLNKG